MPMKLKVGLSKNVGQSESRCLSASCEIELELDPSLMRDDIEGFHRHIRNAFASCRQAVDEEVGRVDTAGSNNGQPRPAGGSGAGRSKDRPATPSQVRAIHAIANRQRLDLAAELRSRFGVERPNDLSLRQASGLIDSLTSATDGS